MPRIFVAILPSAVVRHELQTLADLSLDARWTPEDNLHLTLRFVGELNETELARHAEALVRVRVEPFILPVGNVGVFPTRGPVKVVWAGVGNGHTRLFQLRKQVDEALLTANSGLDVHHFHPHFTLARLNENYAVKPLAKFLERHARFEAPPFRVDQFHLMASEISPGRPPTYRSLRSYALGETGR